VLNVRVCPKTEEKKKYLNNKQSRICLIATFLFEAVATTFDLQYYFVIFLFYFIHSFFQLAFTFFITADNIFYNRTIQPFLHKVRYETLDNIELKVDRCLCGFFK